MCGEWVDRSDGLVEKTSWVSVRIYGPICSQINIFVKGRLLRYSDATFY